ncbi:MAG: hypothetical protein ACLVJH_01780 [Faecalibacterium prausnitzii]
MTPQTPLNIKTGDYVIVETARGRGGGEVVQGVKETLTPLSKAPAHHHPDGRQRGRALDAPEPRG